MSGHPGSRRQFLQATALSVGATAWSGVASHASEDGEAGLHVACNQYPWYTFFVREGRDFERDLGGSIAAVAASGVDGFEPSADAPRKIQELAPLLRKHQLAMRSLYVNSVLHDDATAKESMDRVLAIAERAQQQLGTRIIVTNPSPIRWGGAEAKTDDQLRRQAKRLNQLGKTLASRGLTLAYHNHDVELRHAAREFHHMMLATDPEQVTLCLDAHWIYRGAGDSSVALFDIVKAYGPRITELHLRQSREGVWTEALGDGDIDYRALADYLLGIGVRPHLVLEQAVEKGTPNTMEAVEAHQRSRQYAVKIFGGFAV